MRVLLSRILRKLDMRREVRGIVVDRGSRNDIPSGVLRRLGYVAASRPLPPTPFKLSTYPFVYQSDKRARAGLAFHSGNLDRSSSFPSIRGVNPEREGVMRSPRHRETAKWSRSSGWGHWPTAASDTALACPAFVRRRRLRPSSSFIGARV